MSQDNQAIRAGFIGTGKMATALAGGFIKAGKMTSQTVFAYDVNADAAKHFTEETSAAICKSIPEVLNNADVVFLCVKPQHMKGVLEALQNADAQTKNRFSEILFVTIAAGLPISYFEKGLGSLRLVRVMPNTPCLVGEAASGFAVSSGASEADAKLVKELLETVGVAFELPETLLDAVTGLSGSGPAYVFMMIEALADGGVKMGLPRNAALALAAQTLKGSAEMLLKTGLHPGVLKDQVTSPAGTTIAGVAEMENRGVRGALIAAVEAASKRSAELGK